MYYRDSRHVVYVDLVTRCFRQMQFIHGYDFTLWAGHVARMGEGRGAYRVLVGRPLGRPRRRWEDNIKMDLQEVGWGGMD
jgi:hypothetical protein